MGTIGITDLYSDIKFPELTREQVLNKALTDYRNNLPKAFVNNKITEQDLTQLKTVQKQKIVLTKPFAEYKVGDVLEVKFISNTQQSEPPSFLVIEEKLGYPKYGFGGRGSESFYQLYKEKEKLDIVNETFLQKHKSLLLIAGAVVLGYFAYKKFKK